MLYLLHSASRLFDAPGKVFNVQLYRRAFVHRSYTKHPEAENKEQNIIIEEQPEDCLPLKTKSNERLEFLGDGVLECITKYYLYTLKHASSVSISEKRLKKSTRSIHTIQLPEGTFCHQYVIITLCAQSLLQIPTPRLIISIHDPTS